MPRSVNLTVDLRFQTDPQLEQFVHTVQRLVDDPVAFTNLLKGVMRTTLLAAYRKRFLQSTSKMTGMEKEQAGASYNRKADITLEIGRLTAELAKDISDSDKDVIKRHLEKLTAEFAGGSVLETDPTTRAGIDPDEGLGVSTRERGRGSLSTGQFQARMGAVLNLLALPEYFQVGTDAAGNPVIGIGNLDDLNAIVTPSYGDPNTGGTSKHKILWRQLEFGTGIYAKPSPRLGPTRFKTRRGTWWFGPSDVRKRRFVGLHLRGSRPGNVLTTAAGLPYDSDALLFRQAFFETMQRQLFGR